MAGEKGEKVVGKKGEEAMDKVEMGAMEEKGAATEQRVEEKKVTVVEKRLTAIEEGTEEEEEVEKERAAAGKIRKKQGRDHLEPWWCTNGSFSEKGETALQMGESKEPRHWTKTVIEKGVTSATEEEGGMETPKDVASEEIIVFFSASGKMITLTSSDGKRFKMPEAAARLSSVIADMIDDNGFANDNIPLPHVPSHSLFTVIKYCDKHAAAAATKPDADHNATDNNTMENTASPEETLEEWDRNLIDILNTDALLDLIKAANFLDIKGLLEVASQKVADMIRGKTPEQ